MNREIHSQRGKSGGWPSDLTFSASETADCVQVSVEAVSTEDSVWKRVDPWGLAFLDKVRHEVRRISPGKPLRLKFSVRVPGRPRSASHYEALKRRVSYLAAVNAGDRLEITLFAEGGPDALYTMADLASRPDTERVHSDFAVRGDDDIPGRLEKDFQTYLYGKGLYANKVCPYCAETVKTAAIVCRFCNRELPRYTNSDSDTRRSNDRLALLGPDFCGIGKLASVRKEHGYTVEREFPTGVFRGEVKEENRILPTEFVDLVTLNKRGELSAIEIKLDDSKLEVIPQTLNYALFFYSYRSKLAPLLNKKLGSAVTAGRGLVTYLVSNTFHRKFNSVWPYYSKKAGPLTLKRVTMGHMDESQPSES